jgi:hypothetical protein
MTKPTSAQFHVATRLLAEEGAAGTGASDADAQAAGRVYAKLSRSIAPLIGEGGVRALFVRSAKLSALPCLEALTAPTGPAPAPDPGERLRACLGELDPAASAGAAVALYATFLRLLIALIGERLVWQLLRSEYPALDLGEPKETL